MVLVGVGEGGLNKNNLLAKKKSFKLDWLKRPKTVQKNEIWSRKQMIQNFIFEVYLLISDFLVKILKVSSYCHKKNISTVSFLDAQDYIL